MFPSFAREINRHPAINKKRDKKLVETGNVLREIEYHHHNPKAINVIPSSNVSPGFINGFNGSPVLDEMGNSNFLFFLFSSFISSFYF